MNPNIEKVYTGKRILLCVAVLGAVALFILNQRPLGFGALVAYPFMLVVVLIISIIIGKFVKVIPAIPVIISFLLLFALWPAGTLLPWKMHYDEMAPEFNAFTAYTPSTVKGELGGLGAAQNGVMSRSYIVPINTNDEDIFNFYLAQYRSNGWTANIVGNTNNMSISASKGEYSSGVYTSYGKSAGGSSFMSTGSKEDAVRTFGANAEKKMTFEIIHKGRHIEY